MDIAKTIKHMLGGPEISIFYKFHKPPYGGGNQFLSALSNEFLRRGLDIGFNKIGRNTRVCLFNSFNFDEDKLLSLSKKYRPRMVNRLAGPIGIYRGTDDNLDKKLWELNRRLANHTIFQSEYSYKKYLEIGLDFGDHSIIHNASDPKIFNREGKIPSPDGRRKVRLIATSWSDNPKKGGATLSWLDENLDHTKYDLTFVGRTKSKFHLAKIIEPVASKELSLLLKEHDIYIAPSEDDPCSNALIEALSCGLPTVYLKSGGHPELVGDGGEGFTTKEDLLQAIDKVASNHKDYQGKIEVTPISEVADMYLKAFKIT